MSESVKNLINAISAGSAIETEEAFNSAMAEKISVKLDAMRQDVAANMFATEEVVTEESEQIDELSKDTLNSYRDQAVDHKEKLKNNIARKTDHVQQMKDMGRDSSSDKAELSAAEKLLKNRRAGIDKASEKVAKK
jgi:hypothetical protein